MKYKSLGVHSLEGNCAIGKRNPPSLKKINCKTWLASFGAVTLFPVKKLKTKKSLKCKVIIQSYYVYIYVKYYL